MDTEAITIKHIVTFWATVNAPPPPTGRDPTAMRRGAVVCLGNEGV